MAKRALVTGASEGIGFELCKLLAKDGYSIVLTARNQQQLEKRVEQLKEHKIETHIIVQDLSLPDACEKIVEELTAKNLQIDILINNAGFANYGYFSSNSLEKEVALLQVNIVALTKLTKLLLPSMLKNKDGKIMNLASMAAFVAGPQMAVYYASKAYVLSFSEALACELEGTGVTVTAVCPGATATEFQERAGLGRSKLFSKFKPMDATTVSEIGYRGMMNGDVIVITGTSNKFMGLATRLLPRSVCTHMVKRIQAAR
ncbi:MAG: SDR family oxidoreductase [Cyanobacteria bacterium SZAS LIN-5]|nr:SDR family oxidoreductase [Cyanobacteria bacterium SZAS LIN-5]RTL40351.1 MAG: SDR family oxidoreductase [Candidatus Melainabacteria bacterium]